MPLNRFFEVVRIASSSFLLAFAFTASASAAVPSGARVDDHRILVTAVAGDVDVSMPGIAAASHVGDEVLLPARIVTGDDGTLGLQQSRTAISIAPDSEIEIPEAAYDGQLIGRLVQWRGNVFYDVETRDVERLTVETPYLVAVVKGTQFNVAVLDETTTISLFEGRLEIRSPNGLNVINLEAGEVAISSRDDTAIRVIDMNAANLPTVDRNGGLVAAPSDEGSIGLVGGAEPAAASGRAVDGEPIGGSDGLELRTDAALGAEVAMNDSAMLAGVDGAGLGAALGSLTLDGEIGAKVDLGSTGVGAGVDLGSTDVNLSAGVDLGSTSVDLGADASFDTGALSADLGVGGDLAGASIGADLGASLDLGSGTADLGLGADADLGDTSIGTDLGAGVDLGGGAVDLGLGADASVADLGLDASADLGASTDLVGGSLDAGAGAELGLGEVGLDAGLDTGLDVGDGTFAGNVEVGVELGGAELDAGLDTGLDLTGGEADVGLDVGGLADAGVDAGLDLGGDDAGLDASVTLPGGIDASLDVDLGGGNDDGGLLDIIDVDAGGGLLGGLL